MGHRVSAALCHKRGTVRFEDVWGIYGKMGKPIPSTKPHIYIKVRDRYIYISTLEHPT